MRGGGDIGVKPEINDGVFGHGLLVQLVFAVINGSVFGFKADVGGVSGDRNDGAIELDPQKIFKMGLSLDKVVLIHLKKSIVNSVA